VANSKALKPSVLFRFRAVFHFFLAKNKFCNKRYLKIFALKPQKTLPVKGNVFFDLKIGTTILATTTQAAYVVKL